MKLSRIGLRRLIESVVNEETKSGLTQDSEIRAAVQNILNKCAPDTIEFAYQKDKSKKDSRGMNYVYVNNLGLKGINLVEKIKNCLPNDAQISNESTASFDVRNFAGKKSLKFKFFGKQLTIIEPA